MKRKVLILIAITLLITSINKSLNAQTFTQSNSINFSPLNDGRNTADGLTWYLPNPQSYGIFRTSGAWTGPNYQQLKLSWETGIIIDGGNSYGRSGLILQPNGGNVGIGTTTPSNQQGWNKVLNVNGSGNSKILVTADGETYRTGIYSHSSWLGGGGFIGTESNHNLHLITAYTPRVTILTDGKVGIGTTTPQQKLHIEGNILVSGAASTLLFRGTSTTDWGYWGIEYEAGAKGLNFWTPYTSPNGLQNYCLFINDNGNIGMGTNDTNGYKLAVKGSMIAEKVVVKLQANWPDFVFTENHKMQSLFEIEAFIKTNKHLPDVPSAAEVKEKGIDVGEMNVILLKKIEEMTLMMIEQNKSIEALKNENNAIRIQVQEISKK